MNEGNILIASFLLHDIIAIHIIDLSLVDAYRFQLSSGPNI
jgi:hypothetical protein